MNFRSTIAAGAFIAAMMQQESEFVPAAATSSAALTGTITASVNEADIVTGGKTLIITLTGDTWIAAGPASFDLQRQNIINGVTSAQSEALGWNLVPKALQSVAGVVRTDATTVTITWDAFATYDITAQETITVTVPGSALTLGAPIVATPTFTVDPVVAAPTFPEDDVSPAILIANHEAPRLAAIAYSLIDVSRDSEIPAFGAVQLSGTASSSSSTTGTLQVAGTDADPPQLEAIWALPQYTEPEAATMFAGPESSAYHPVSPVAISGTAASAASATGTVQVSAIPVDVSRDFPALESLTPPTWPELPLWTDMQERLPQSAVALSGTATSAASATGTVQVAGTSLEVDEAALPVTIPPLPGLEDNSSDLALPFGAVQIAGTAVSTSSTVGTVAVAGTTNEDDIGWSVSGPDLWAADAALTVTAQDNEAIPVDGTVAPVVDTAPGEDDTPSLVDFSVAPHFALPDEAMPVAPVSITGIAASTANTSGTVQVAGTTNEDDVGILTGPDLTAADTALAVQPNNEAIPVDGTVVAAGDQPQPVDEVYITDPEPSPPLPGLLDNSSDLALPFGAVQISGTAASTASATGTISVAGTTNEDDVAWLITVGPDLTAADTALAVQPNNEAIPVDGTVVAAGDQPQPVDEVYITDPEPSPPYLAIIVANADNEAIPVDGTIVAPLTRHGAGPSHREKRPDYAHRLMLQSLTTGAILYDPVLGVWVEPMMVPSGQVFGVPIAYRDAVFGVPTIGATVRQYTPLSARAIREAEDLAMLGLT